MATTIKPVIATILKHEGGYQNNKADAANKNSRGEWVGTNLGITPQVYEEYFKEVPSQADMRRLKKEQAAAIYEENYVRPVRDNLGIPEDSPVFAQVVDIAVNHGYSGAVAMVQRAANTTVDGKAGPGTQQAIAAMSPSDLNEALVAARKEEYSRIVKSKPETATFLKGWNRRAESFSNPQESTDGERKPKPDPLAAEGI